MHTKSTITKYNGNDCIITQCNASETYNIWTIMLLCYSKHRSSHKCEVNFPWQNFPRYFPDSCQILGHFLFSGKVDTQQLMREIRSHITLKWEGELSSSSHQRHFIERHIIQSSSSHRASEVDDDEKTEEHRRHHDKHKDLIPQRRFTTSNVQYTGICVNQSHTSHTFRMHTEHWKWFSMTFQDLLFMCIFQDYCCPFPCLSRTV